MDHLGDIPVAEALDEALRDIAALKDADDSDVLSTRWAWNLRDDVDGLHSTENMTDEELLQALVEDLLIVHDFNMAGRSLPSRMSDLVRFLPEASCLRLQEVLEDDDFVRSLLITAPNGIVSLRSDRLEQAMDFAGVWLDGHSPPEDEVVLFAGRLPS